MSKRGLCCCLVSVRPSVRLFVCLSVCHLRVLYIQMAEDIVKLLSLPGSTIILVFDSERRYPIP